MRDDIFGKCGENYIESNPTATRNIVLGQRSVRGIFERFARAGKLLRLTVYI